MYHEDLAEYANSVQLCNHNLENNLIYQDEYDKDMAEIERNKNSIFISEHSIYYMFEWLEPSDENLFGKYKEQINETLNDITENIGDSVKTKEVRRLLNEATKLLSAT